MLDLGQQLDQIRLFGEVLAGEHPELRVTWLGSNKLGYLPLGVASLVAPVEWLPRVALLLVAACWLAAVHAIGAWLGRPVAVSILASTLLLGCVFYAGMFNFLLGVVSLAYWARELREERRDRPIVRVYFSTLGGIALAYLAHGLWLVVGGFAVATYALLVHFRPRETLARALAVATFQPLAFAWANQLEVSGWQTSSKMILAPLGRLADPDIAASIAYGGLRGPVEPLLLSLLLLWIALGLWRAAREDWRGVDRFLSPSSAGSASPAPSCCPTRSTGRFSSPGAGGRPACSPCSSPCHRRWRRAGWRRGSPAPPCYCSSESASSPGGTSAGARWRASKRALPRFRRRPGCWRSTGASRARPSG